MTGGRYPVLFIMVFAIFLSHGACAQKLLTQIPEEDIQEIYSNPLSGPRSYEVRLISDSFTPEPLNEVAASSLHRNVYYLVQFYNLSEDDYNRLLNQNVKFLGYVPGSTYIVKDPDSILKTGNYNIRWIGVLGPEQKIEPGLKGYLADSKDEKINITLVLFENPEGPEIQAMEELGSIVHSKSNENYIVIETTKDSIPGFANLDFVQLIHKYEPIRLLLDRSSKVIAADYVWAQGNDASGVTVGIMDSGIQKSNKFFRDINIHYAEDFVDLDGVPEAECGDMDPGNTPQCNDGFNNDNDGRIDEGIHGILVAGVISGQGTYGSINQSLKGISNRADLVVSRISNEEGNYVVTGGENVIWRNILDPDNNGDFYEPNSADIISISWGVGNGGYAQSSLRADETVNGVLSNGRKRVLVVAAAGNDGKNKWVASPATGKNVLSVGASSNFINSDRCYYDVCYDPSNLGVLSISCRGTDNGRVKPDILAPGALIETSSIDNDTSLEVGTSISAPHASAVAAQVIHEYPSATPELIKSMIIASAVGGGTTDIPNMNQVWGRLNAYSAVYQTPDEYYDAYHTGTVGNLKSGRPIKRGYSLYIPENTDKLIITMVYSDDAGSGVLYNDLDLYLEYPPATGNTRLPNGHDTYKDDNINNVEKYVIENPQPGDWNAWVEGLWFNDLYGTLPKSIDYAVNIRIIKRTRQPDIRIFAHANPYHANLNKPFKIYADVEVRGLAERDVYAQIVAPYSEILTISDGYIATNDTIDVLGDILANSLRRTRNFELVATGPGRYNIAVNAYGRDELGNFQATADMVTIIVCDQDEDNYYDSSCGGTDCNDSNLDIHPGAAEVCDGTDNNCNGQTDEGFDQDGDAYTTCGGDCNDQNPGINPGARELCDGLDNDCDKQVDEGCTCRDGETMPCGTDVGECEKGTQTCSSGKWGPCLGGSGPVPEACPHDGKDNDCDWEKDEIFCGRDYCYDWVGTIPSPINYYIEELAMGHYCANDWRKHDIDSDGYTERYLLIGEPFRTWFYCLAQEATGYRVHDIKGKGGSPSYGCTYSGGTASDLSQAYCDSPGEYSYHDQVFSEPQVRLSSPGMFCFVEPPAPFGGYGWDSHELIWASGGKTEYIMYLRCGVDSDCPSDRYCYKPVLSDPTTYYCKSRCGNGVCDPGETCPQDGSGPEICDGLDNDCNGVADDSLAVTCSSDSDCLPDACHSGTYRDFTCQDPGKCSSQCSYTTITTDSDGDEYDTECGSDCDDYDNTVYPGAPELCDEKDNNCNGQEDEGCPITCSFAGDCGRDGLTGDYCQDNDAYQLYRTYTCSNPGRTVSFCSHQDTSQLVQDCGETGHGDWSRYCEGRNVTRNRTVYLRGCSAGSCYENETLETETEACTYTCREGNCTTLEGDCSLDCTVNIFDLALVGLAYGSMPGDGNWNPQADLKRDGRINIFDLAAVGINFGKTC